MQRTASLRYFQLWITYFSLLISTTSPCLAAGATFSDDWLLRGYFNQSYLKTTDPVNYGGDTGDGDTDIRSVGLNFSNDKLLTSTRFAAQMTYREFGGFDEGDLELDFLVLDHTLASDFDYHFGAELGRLKTNFGFFISGWDVAHARPFALLPITVYQEGYREFTYSADAARFRVRLYKQGYWQFELFLGKPAGDAEKIREVFPQDTRFALDGLFTAGILHFESTNGLVNGYFGHGSVESTATLRQLENINLPFGLGDPGKIRLTWTTGGLKFNYNMLYVMTELRYGKIDFRGLLPPPPFLSFVPQNLVDSAVLRPMNYYVAAGYRFLNNLEFYTYFGQMWADKDDKKGQIQSERFNVPPHSYYLRTVSVGLRWDINKSFMLGAQWHRSHGSIGLSTVDNENVFDLPEQWDMLNVIASYSF